MPRLYSESSRPYPGRSVRPGRVISGRINHQLGHWLIKPGRAELLPTCASEQGSKKPEDHGASWSNP